MKTALALICALSLQGCAAQQYSAVAADSATTAVGLTIPGIVESNPLGWATVPIRLAVIEHAKKQPIAEGTPILHAVTATSWGAAVNNILVIAGVGIAPLAGLATGLYLWHAGEHEREFWRACEAHRQLEGKHLACVYTPAT